MSALKGIIIFLAGGVIGAGVSAFVTYKRIIEREQKRADEKIKSHDEAYQEYVKSLETEVATFREGIRKTYISEDSENKEEQTVKNSEENIINTPKKPNEKGRDGGPVKKDYTMYYKARAEKEYPGEPEGAESLDYIDEDPNEELNSPEYSKMPPKVITYQEYYNPEYEYHDKIVLNYFQEDDILATEEDEALDSITYDGDGSVKKDTAINGRMLHVGDCLEKSGFTKNQNKVLYIRNFRLSTDYEICKVFGAFSDVV